MVTAKEIAEGWPEYGIHSDIPFKDYLAIDAVSNSYLGRLKDCPAKALMKEDDTTALGFGRALHSIVLEGFDAFHEDFAVAPKFDRRTTVGKAQYADFMAGVGSKGIITADEFSHAKNIRRAVFDHPFAKKVLGRGIVEQTVIWESDGIQCKSRPDALPGGNTRALVDLKTTEDASYEGFMRSVKKYGYARGAAFYLDAVNFGRDLGLYDTFIFVVVEKKPPYIVGTYQMSGEFIERGREEYKELLALDKECKENNFYPAYRSGELEMLELPLWW